MSSVNYFYNQYETLINKGLNENYSEKEIFDAIYEKEFENYLRKGIHPRLDELQHVMNFVKMYRSSELNTKDNSNTQDDDKNKIANNIRNVIHNLDIYNNKNDMVAYENERFRWFETVEEKRYTSYWDSNDVNKRQRTVGIGFNMDANKEEAWNKAFPDKNIRPSFNDVYNGKTKLTDVEVRQLFDYSINTREKELKNLFKDDWKKFKPNERLAVEDKYFQSNNINAIKNDLKNYVNSDNENYLINAVDTLSYNPNSTIGIQRRRNASAILLNSTACPLYSKPSEAPLPEHYKNKHFIWIWNSNSNSKNSNPYHRDVLNGEIFKIDSDPWKWMTSNRLKGCHCTYEIVD